MCEKKTRFNSENKMRLMFFGYVIDITELSAKDKIVVGSFWQVPAFKICRFE